MSCRRRRGYRRFSTSAYRLLGDFEVAINGGVWVATGGRSAERKIARATLPINERKNTQ